MLIRIVASAVIIGLIFSATEAKPALAEDDSERKAKHVDKVKAGISKLGTGEFARIEVKLKDKTKLLGFISEVADDSFALTDPNTGITKSVAYDSVSKVKGHNLSTGAKVAIGIGIGILIGLLIILATGGINT